MRRFLFVVLTIILTPPCWADEPACFDILDTIFAMDIQDEPCSSESETGCVYINDKVPCEWEATCPTGQYPMFTRDNNSGDNITKDRVSCTSGCDEGTEQIRTASVKIIGNIDNNNLNLTTVLINNIEQADTNNFSKIKSYMCDTTNCPEHSEYDDSENACKCIYGYHIRGEDYSRQTLTDYNKDKCIQNEYSVIVMGCSDDYRNINLTITIDETFGLDQLEDKIPDEEEGYIYDKELNGKKYFYYKNTGEFVTDIIYRPDSSDSISLLDRKNTVGVEDPYEQDIYLEMICEKAKKYFVYGQSLLLECSYNDQESCIVHNHNKMISRFTPGLYFGGWTINNVTYERGANLANIGSWGFSEVIKIVSNGTASYQYSCEDETACISMGADDYVFATCPEGYYCLGGDNDPMSCPAGATSNAKATNVSDCYLKGGTTQICDTHNNCFTIPVSVNHARQ